jgi:hypothetical protein
MELNRQLQAEIAEIFKSVQYGRITFFLSPEKPTLNYTKEIYGNLPIQQDETGTQWSNPLTTTSK